MNNYEDIMYLAHYEPSSKHVRMSIYNRSAQFSSFKALDGFGSKITETARTTSDRIELDENEKNILDYELCKLKEKDNVCITYFVKDKYKKGGKYLEVFGFIKKIDPINHLIILDNKTLISVNDIIKINKI